MVPGDTIDSGRLIDGYVRTGEKFLYTYDFGDNWEHVILVEKYLPVSGTLCSGGEIQR